MADKISTLQNVTENTIPEDFTVSLALIDAVPVLLFAVAIIILGMKAGFSPLIMTGGAICFLSGALKVSWKLIVATQGKNVFWLYKQMPPAMSVGFLLIIIGCILSRSALKAAFTGIGPVSIVFLCLWVFGMGLMSFFAVKMDQSNVNANWVEQITNGVSQLCLCVALARL